MKSFVLVTLFAFLLSCNRNHLPGFVGSACQESICVEAYENFDDDDIGFILKYKFNYPDSESELQNGLRDLDENKKLHFIMNHFEDVKLQLKNGDTLSCKFSHLEQRGDLSSTQIHILGFDTVINRDELNKLIINDQTFTNKIFEINIEL